MEKLADFKKSCYIDEDCDNGPKKDDTLHIQMENGSIINIPFEAKDTLLMIKEKVLDEEERLNCSVEEMFLSKGMDYG